MIIILFFTWNILLCATSSRLLKGPDENKKRIASIREQAKSCTTFECFGEKCYQLKEYVKIYHVQNIEDFAKFYEKDLKERGWWHSGQDAIKEIKENSYRAMTLQNNDIVVFDTYSPPEGKMNFDQLHELCHVLAGDGGITPNFNHLDGIKIYEGIVNIMAKKFAIQNENLVDLTHISQTYPELTLRLEELFDFFRSENIISNMLFGTGQIILPNNVIEEDEIFKDYYYNGSNRGLVLLTLDVYNKFKFYTHLFKFQSHPGLEYILKKIKNLNHRSFFIYYKDHYFQKILEKALL